MKIGFEFPLDAAQEWDGFNEPGIETFSGNPFEHLGREVPQNTLDATRTTPAKIRIRQIEVPVSSIPDVASLKATMEKCADASSNESDKAQAFFARAKSLLSKKKISVLLFEDSNTTGVVGPCENGRPYYALMKATGQSKKTTGTATGSFGIGKFAPFTVSDLRTIFISTVWKDDKGNWHHYAQGKSILMSHHDGQKVRRGTGYWGERKNCQPVVDDLKPLPDWLRRVDEDGSYEGQQGTTLAIVGFSGKKGWQSVLAANIAENFFGAIAKGNLEVEIVDGLSVTSETLSDILSSQEIREALRDQKGEPEQIEFSEAYYRALTGNEKVVEQTENLHLGHCELHVLVGEGLPRKVAILRNGMLITDELNGLKRFGDFKEFAAVLECKSDKGNALLRAMEPPRHDDFEPERLADEKKSAGRIALREIAVWVRKMLRRHAQDPVSEVTTLDELAQFFGEELDTNEGLRSQEENPVGAINIRARPLKKPKPPAGYPNAFASGEEQSGDAGDDDAEGGTGESGVGGDGGGSNDSQGGTTTGGGGSGAGTGGKPVPAATSLRNVRAIPLSLSQRRIAFTVQHAGTYRILLEDSGADTNRPLPVVASSVGKIEDGGISGVKVEGGKRMQIDVTLSQDFPGTIRVVAHAI